MTKFDDIDWDARLPDESKRYRLLDSGAVLDRSNNKIVARKITSEEGRAMANARWDKYRQSTATWVLREAQAINPDVKTEEDAWGLLVSRVFQQIMDSEKPRGDDLEKVGRAMGAMPNITDARAVISPADSNLESREVLKELAHFAAELQKELEETKRQTVDGQVLDK